MRSSWFVSAAVVAGLLGAVQPATLAGQVPYQRELTVTPFGAVLDFHPDGAWRRRARAIAARRAALRAAGNFPALNAALRAGPPPSPAALTGIERVPAVLFRYQDVGTGAAHDSSAFRAALFDATPPAGRPYTLRTYYEELSNGLMSVQGTALGWFTLPGTEVTYTGTPGTCTGNPTGTTNCNGIFSAAASSAMQTGMRLALAMADSVVDFGQFDNDGPDGIPNTADDDGYVDMILFVQSEQDGACGGATNNHIWAHRWVLSGATSNDLSNSPSAPGGHVGFRDYTVQSGVGGSTGCVTTDLMPIGTTAHETGHAFGLPDLYDTGGATEGIGEWGLMGSGNWTTQFSPARMEAWSLDQLGWIAIVPLTADGTYAVGSAGTADTAFLVMPPVANPRNEYFLIENRQAALADSAMIRRHCERSGRSFPSNCGGGLAIWQIDGQKLASGGAVNSGSVQGVALVQADGLNQLRSTSGGNRGDAGDVYPGVSANTRFDAYSLPPAVKNADGQFVGFAVDSIREVASQGPMAFRLRFGVPLAVLATGPGSVAATPAGSYTTPVMLGFGVQVLLVAQPNAGAVLDGWRGDTTSTRDTLVLVMNRVWAVEAVFAPLLAVTAPSPPGAVMGASYALSLAASGGLGTYGWTVASGSLPPGLRLSSGGAISGIPEQTGSFPATLRVASGSQTKAVPLTLSVTAPALVTATVLGALVGTGDTLGTDEARYLDLLGNRNGRFDVGDFLAFVQVTGGAVSAEMMAEALGKGAAR
jgi:M6 family metalloprotease-like protein